MDDLQFYVLFNSISVISGRSADENERLCAMEPRLRVKRSSPQAGLELTTARSVGQRLTHRATGAPPDAEVQHISVWGVWGATIRMVRRPSDVGQRTTL